VTGFFVKLGMTASISVIWWLRNQNMKFLYELENELKMEKLI
jgi:hypothetical protein